MSVVSGISGQLSTDGTNAAASVRNWSISYRSNNPAGHSTSAAPGMEFNVPGIKEWEGSFDYYGKFPPVIPGATGAGSTTFVGHTGAKQVTGTIFPTAATINVDIESGAIIGGTVNFVSNSALVFSETATALADTSVPSIYSSVGCKAQWAVAAASPSYADITDVRTWSLMLACEAKRYASSDTGGVRKANPGRKSARVDIGVYQAALDAYNSPAMLPGSSGALKLFVDASTFWEARWVTVGEESPSVDIEGGENGQVSLGFDYTSHTGISGTITVGYIHKPGAVAIWP